jgi:hypothetical protein
MLLFRECMDAYMDVGGRAKQEPEPMHRSVKIHINCNVYETVVNLFFERSTAESRIIWAIYKKHLINSIILQTPYISS